MSVLKKIQEQPVHVRKITFWIIVIILAITFLFVWVDSIKIRIEGAKEKNIFDESKLPNFQENLENLPKIESGLSEEEQKQLLEEFMKEQGNQTSPSGSPQ